MHRVLVVEDERQSLATLCKDTGSRRPGWELEFTTGAGPAVASCDERSVHVVVLDLGALGLSGLQLLGYLKQAYPGTTRIVLAHNAGPELTYRALPRAQHCVTRPVDLLELETSIERTLALQDRLANPSVRALVPDRESLPRTPLFSSLGDLIDDDSSTTGSLAEVVGGDEAITERMLSLVNSRFFGLSTRVSDPREAITILGPTTLRSVVLNLELFRAVRAIDCPSLDGDGLGRHALAAATVASRLVEGTNAWNQVRVAGLLHDMGRIVLAAAAPDAYSEILSALSSEGPDLLAAEQDAFGCTHADVGAVAADLWGLPWTIVEPIALHHDPSPTWFDEPFDERHAVYIAERLLGEGTSTETDSTDELTVALAVHGLQKELDGWRRATVECLENGTGRGEPERAADDKRLLRDAG